MRLFFLFFLCFNTLLAQKITINGVVQDVYKQPLPGASIIVKGTSTGTTTDIDGKFSIEVKKGTVLEVNYIGFKSKRLQVTDLKEVTITLEEDNSQLEEVVVVGYGIQRKASVVGYSQSFRKKEKKIKQKPRETYKIINENGYKSAVKEPISTFAADVDRASYSNVRRKIEDGELPEKDAVRIEEMINYFEYDYPQPDDKKPLKANFEISQSPWNTDNLLLKIGLQATKIDLSKAPASNIVFLIDVSGSMNSPERLPLLKESFKLLLNSLKSTDKVAIVTYAGSEGLALPSTFVSEKEKIIEVLDDLEAGGSTAGEAGITLAYKVAHENFIEGGNNRIILATDGDFNVGVNNHNDLERLVTKHRKTGVYISVLGFGMGNYRDDMAETIANKGNGNYAYIDDISEAKKVLVNEFGGTMFTIAKDVKLQLEFNPALVKEYRLIGYENRLLEEEDFDNDAKDAGEIGSGHSLTVLYEIVPSGGKISSELRYQSSRGNSKNINELAFLKIRYKEPKKVFGKSILFSEPIPYKVTDFSKTSDDFRFATAVAQYGMLLRNSEFKGNSSYENVIETAENASKNDPNGYRKKFIELVHDTYILAD